MIVNVNGKVVVVVKVMVELEGSLYYSKTFFFSRDPVYFIIVKGSGSIRDWVFLAIIAYLMDGSSYTIV